MRILLFAVKGFVPFCIAFMGLFMLYFDYWSEIFWPVHSRQWINLAILSVVVIVGAGVLSVVIAAVIWFGKSPVQLKIRSFLDVLLCVTLLAAIPLRFEFFSIGAKSRVALCGGAQTVREAALAHLTKPTDSARRKPMSGTIRNLTDTEVINFAVVVHATAGAVEIRIPSRRNTSDQFSYVAMQSPTGTCPLKSWRTWRLADGLFFCQSY